MQYTCLFPKRPNLNNEPYEFGNSFKNIIIDYINSIHLNENI